MQSIYIYPHKKGETFFKKNSRIGELNMGNLIAIYSLFRDLKIDKK